MNFFRKPIFLISSIILFAFFISFIFKTLIKDIEYSHTTHGTAQNPFNWFSFMIEHNINLFTKSIIKNNEIGLPQVRLFIAESNQRSLISNTPSSTKNWQKAFLQSDKVLKNVEVRHRGDNSVNWVFPKKSWSVKTKKSETFNRPRVLNYIAPQEIHFIRNFSSYHLANRMGVLSPSVRLVELFINEESNGIYFELEKLNESFLRQQKIMPVNLYKGEQYNIEKFLGIHDNLFNNPSLWSKVAVFNKTNEQDYSDMRYLLELLRQSETSKESLDELFNILNIDTWSNFGAYQILAQNYHNYYTHNMRLILDPWSGEVSPVIHDADSRHGLQDTGNKIIYDKVLLEESSNKIMEILNRSSNFIDRKYQKLFEYTTNTDVLLDEINFLCSTELETQLAISTERDINLLTLVYLEANINNKISRDLIKPKGQKIVREKICNSMLLLRNAIKKRIMQKPRNSWSKSESGFNIIVNGEMATSNILLTFKTSVPKWIALDTNGNNTVDSKDIMFFPDINKKEFLIPYRFYANRIRLANNFRHVDMNSQISISPTKFSFITSSVAPIEKIFAENIFSKSSFKIPEINDKATMPNIFNQPINNLNNPEKIIEISGVLDIKKTTVIDQPVNIKPGTIINLSPKSSLIFRNKVTAKGTNQEPITFKNLSDSSWGVIALQGQKANNSRLKNIIINGGSGAIVKNIHYTGMLSIHNVDDVVIENIKMINNDIYDDMIHIVYSKNIFLDNVNLSNSLSDSIDIDISSNIVMRNLNISQAGNDGVDFMDSSGLIIDSTIYESGDKGVSAGENSKVLIYNSSLSKNIIGLAVKDGSIVNIEESSLSNNKQNISAFSKNWQYGNKGGIINLHDSEINGNINTFKISENSIVNFDNSSCINKELISNVMSNESNFKYHRVNMPKKNKTIELLRSNIYKFRNNNFCSK